MPKPPTLITALTNPKFKLVHALQTQRKTRFAENAFVIEGVRLVEEAVRAQAEFRLVFFTEDLEMRGQELVQTLAQQNVEVCQVTPAVMNAATDTQTPAGLLAVVALSKIAPAITPVPWALVLDGLADPGNLGTILRTANAAGVPAVFLAPGTVDAYSPKVVRGAMGAHFHLPMRPVTWDTLPQYIGHLTTWLADMGVGQPYHQVDWRAPSALIVSAEATGPSLAAQRFTTQRVHIPMPGRAESLNAAVAAGILLFEVARQRLA